MKTKFLMILAAAALAASCSGVSDKTWVKISALDPANAATEVSVKMGLADSSYAVDTTYALTDGKLQFTLPTKTLERVVVKAGGKSVEFVPDGGLISIVIDSTGNLEAKAKAGSIADRGLQTIKFEKSLSDSLMAYYNSVSEDSSLSKDEVDAKVNDYYDQMTKKLADNGLKLMKENPDNFVATYGFSEAQEGGVSDSLLAEAIKGLSPELRARWTGFDRALGRIEARQNTAEGKMFTDFDIEGHKLSDYVGKGKYTLVDFWASWCGPCKREIPYLKKAYDTYRGEAFDQLSVAVWDQPQASLDTAAAYGINWNHIINGQAVPTDLYGIEGIPHIILFGPDGTILKRDLRGDDISAEIAKYVQPGGKLVK